MKTIVLSLLLTMLCSRNFAQNNAPVRDTLFEKLMDKAADVDIKEIKEFTDMKSVLSSGGDNKASCEYIMALKQYFSDRDPLFDQLQRYQKSGKTTANDDKLIALWVPGRTHFHVAVNKVLGMYKCMTEEQLQDDLRKRIFATLKALDLTPYIEAARALKTIPATATPAEICKVFSAFKKESDILEPGLEKLFILYVGDGPDNNTTTARTVVFPDPLVSETAERFLKFRTTQFIPRKAEIGNALQKYNCNY